MRIILLSLAVAAFVIGVHQTMTVGPKASYFIFMIALVLIFLSRLVKGKEIHGSTPKPAEAKPNFKPSNKKK